MARAHTSLTDLDFFFGRQYRLRDRIEGDLGALDEGASLALEIAQVHFDLNVRPPAATLASVKPPAATLGLL